MPELLKETITRGLDKRVSATGLIQCGSGPGAASEVASMKMLARWKARGSRASSRKHIVFDLKERLTCGMRSSARLYSSSRPYRLSILHERADSGLRSGAEIVKHNAPDA
jgi:hypothetical protein